MARTGSACENAYAATVKHKYQSLGVHAVKAQIGYPARLYHTVTVYMNGLLEAALRKRGEQGLIKVLLKNRGMYAVISQGRFGDLTSSSEADYPGDIFCAAPQTELLNPTADDKRRNDFRVIDIQRYDPCGAVQP